MEKVTQDELSKLLISNKDGMYRLAYSIVKNDADAQDAVSDAILLALEKRNQIKNKDNMKAWLMQIVVNSSKQIIRKMNRVSYIEESQFEQSIAFEGDELWLILSELEEELREVIVLYYYLQFSVKEISGIVKVPEGTVKSRLSRARTKLAKILR